MHVFLVNPFHQSLRTLIIHGEKQGKREMKECIERGQGID